MLVTLNIGLGVPGTHNTGSIGAGHAAKVAESLGHIVGLQLRTVRHGEGTEPTLIVDIAPIAPRTGTTWLEENIYSMAEQLKQDCIAVWFHECRNTSEQGHGALIGPKAADWGQFNPVHFHFIGAQA